MKSSRRSKLNKAGKPELSHDMQSRPFIRAAFLYVKEGLGGKNEIGKAKNIAGKFYAVFVIFWSGEFQGQPQSLLKWRLHRIFRQMHH